MARADELAAMKRVLEQISQLCEQVDGNSLEGLREPPQDEGMEQLSGESDEGDAAKLDALKRQEEGV